MMLRAEAYLVIWNRIRRGLLLARKRHLQKSALASHHTGVLMAKTFRLEVAVAQGDFRIPPATMARSSLRRHLRGR